MNESCLVGCYESAAGLAEYVEDFGPRLVSLPIPSAKRLPIDEFHRNEHGALELSDIEDCNDIGVGDASNRLCLSHEPRVVSTRGPWLDQLERDSSIEFGIVGGIHDPHTACTEGVDHQVAIDEGSTG